MPVSVGRAAPRRAAGARVGASSARPRQLWQLTPDGREEHRIALADDVGAHRHRRRGCATPYAAFLALNEQFKALCGDWQLRDGAPNDHSDAAYDAAVVARLVALNDEALPVVAAMADVLERLQPYAPRLVATCQRVVDGETNMFTGVMCGSYHDVWMELHEDLILTQGIDRRRRVVLMARFGRVLTAMVTPFDDDGALDLDVAAQLARYLQDHGNDGLVVAGTTGESPVLTDDERLSLFAAVIEAVTIPVIAGTGTNDTAHSVHLTKEAAALGAAGVLAVCPYYNRPSQAGIEAHIRAMAAASDLPVMVYDIPVRTGRKIDDRDAAAPVPRGAQHRCAEGRRRQPGRDRRADQLGARRLRGLQRRRRDDAAAAGQRHRRHRRRRHALDRATTTRRCSTCGRRATPSAPAWSTAACSRASRSRPATTRPTRSRPRR